MGRFSKVSRSLWGVGMSRSATPANGNGNYDAATSSYPPSSTEAHLRKLADFAFMLRDWKLANSIYDMLKKDFSNDKAWKHHAGAQVLSPNVAFVHTVGNGCNQPFAHAFRSHK